MKNPNQNQKQRDLSDASKEEDYYNSESEGKEYKINDEIFKDFDEKYEDYFYAPEEYGTWETQTQEET